MGTVRRARIRPPRVPADAISRTRVSAKLRSGFERPLTVVLAGAGYGKSTAVVQALTASDHHWAWCSCDRRMRSAPALAASIASAVAERAPGFGATLSLMGDAEELAVLLADELESTLAEDLVVVLDDVHLTFEQDAWELVAHLIEEMPESLHLVLISRLPLSLPLARMRAQQRLAEIGEADLRFDRAEASDLVGGVVSAEELDDMLRVTEGWATGMTLVARSRDGRASFAAADDETLFAFLAEEVLADLGADSEVQLEQLAVLDRINPVLAEAVTQRPTSVDLLRKMAVERLFVITIDADDGWFRFHHLLLALLRTRLSRRPAPELARLHTRAAEGWQHLGEPLEAVRHLLEAGDHERAADLLEPLAEELALSPDGDELGRWLQRMPRPVVEARPGLALAHAVLAFLQGRREEAFTSLDRVIRRLAHEGEHDRAALALTRLWQSMNSSGTSARHRIATMERLMPLVDPQAERMPLARLQLATGYAWAGQRERARREIASVLECPAGSTPSVAAFAAAAQAFYVDYPGGLADRAEAQLAVIRRTLEDAGTADAGMLAVFVGAFRSIVLNDLGRFEEALAEAEHLWTRAVRFGFAQGGRRSVDWFRQVAYAGLGRIGEITAGLAALPPPADGSVVNHYAYRYLTPAAAVAASKGDIATLEEIATRARQAIAAQGPELDQPPALCDIGEAALRCGAFALATSVLRLARASATDLDTPWSRARACILLAARIPSEAPSLAQEALELTEAHSISAVWTRRCLPWAGEVLARRLLGDDEHDHLVGRLLVASGPEAIEAAARTVADAPAPTRARLAACLGASGPQGSTLLADPDPAVRRSARRSRAGTAVSPRPAVLYRGLGGFGIWRGDDEVSRSAFGRERARALLASLLCAQRPVHREELLEWHWPDLPPDRAVRAFHVTMHALRRALEPQLTRGTPASTVISTGEAYDVRLAPGDRFDAKEFLGLARRAADDPDDLAAYADAEAAYTGTLFPEWPYAAWAEQLRRECETTYSAVLLGHADALLRTGRAREALSRFERLIASEPEREEWHRRLMLACEAAGERAIGLRQFHACRAVLRRELGVEPSDETQAAYRRLLGAVTAA